VSSADRNTYGEECMRLMGIQSGRNAGYGRKGKE
jgi:hypothetical protein